jgi:iron complex transport system substrate-binding protein
MRRFAAAAMLALSVLGASCTRTPVSTVVSHPPGYPMTMTDDQGSRVTLDKAPQRIVTWGPSITEILFAIGEGQKVVGVSGPYDNFPPAAKGITQVGGAGDFGTQPSIEKVLSLHPDLMISAFVGGQSWEHELRAAGVPVFDVVSTNLPDVFSDIEEIGGLTGDPQGAAALVSQMQSIYETIKAEISGPPVSCFYEIGWNPLYTVGPGSFIYDILQRAGCAPVSSAAKTPYPQWSVESLIREDPAYYFVSTESSKSASSVARRVGYSALTAVKDGHVFVVDSDLIDRPGPRVIEGLQLLASILHPGEVPAPSVSMLSPTPS